MELVELTEVAVGEWVTDELQSDEHDEQDWWHVITPAVDGTLAVTRYDGSPAIVTGTRVWRLLENGAPLTGE